MEKTKILVVEDEAIVAKDIQTTLESLGYAVPAVVASGAEAIEQAKLTEPDLVLMDIVLKGEMDGIEAAERIRTHLTTPVIFVTAYADEQTLQRAKLQEPFGYILKPFDTKTLTINIEMALYKHEMEQRLRESEARYRDYSRNLTLLNETSQILTSTLEMAQIINQLLQAAVAITDAEASSVWMWEEPSSADLVCQAMLVDKQYTAPGHLRLPAGEGIAGWVAQKEQSVIVNDVRSDDRFSPEIDAQTGFRTKSLLAVPLKMREQTYGVLEVVNKREKSDAIPAGFGPDDRFLVETLAASAVIAIDNARLVEALREYAVELEARNQDLDAFAHTAAHDLRNPLARVVGYAEFLEDEYATLPEVELRRVLHRIARNGRRMDNIIDELLLLAGVRHVSEVEFSALDMAEIVAEATGRLEDQIRDQRAEIRLPTDWPVIRSYGPWLEEVWVNYISNAIHYGGRPPRVELGATSQRDGSVRFWVRDNGQGLTVEEQARLFTPFTRVDQVRARGHGLGLSIVRRIVEKLGGHVGVESQPGQGSCFSFTLPKSPDHAFVDRIDQ